MQIRWGIKYNFYDGSLYGLFYEAVPFEEPDRILWSMSVAYDVLASLEMQIEDEVA